MQRMTTAAEANTPTYRKYQAPADIVRVARTRVRRGADLLDQKVPDWCAPLTCGVQKGEFAIDDVHCCVLGLSFAFQAAAANTDGYTLGSELLGLSTSAYARARKNTVHYGFERPSPAYTKPGQPMYEYRLLQQLWEEEIDKRCAEAADCS